MILFEYLYNNCTVTDKIMLSIDWINYPILRNWYCIFKLKLLFIDLLIKSINISIIIEFMVFWIFFLKDFLATQLSAKKYVCYLNL